MCKRLALSEDNLRPMLTLRNSIVPMFNASPLPKDVIRIICDVPRRIDTRAAGLQESVNDNAVIDCDGSLLQKFRDRDCTHSNNHKVARNFLLIAQEHSLNSTLSFNRRNTRLFHNPHSTSFVILFEKS